jgi:hypothetical protein
MEVQTQFLYAYLDQKESMFDFSVNFFIISSINKTVEAFYTFDKVSTKKQDNQARKIDKMKSSENEKQTQRFWGADERDANERKPFKFDTLIGEEIGSGVGAQVELYSYNPKHFTVTVSLRNKKDNSITITFQGEKPSWLDDDAIFHGQLMMFEVKDLEGWRKLRPWA